VIWYVRCLTEGVVAGAQVVMITTKGEAIAIGIAQMTTATIASCDHGCVAKVGSQLPLGNATQSKLFLFLGQMFSILLR
jgi:hypothetical protein